MIKETFLNYKNYRYFWLNFLLVAGLTALYVLDSPIGGPNGGTVYGYTVGALATAGILYLMWYGIRKRSYSAKETTLKGCLAAHVWLGIALAIIVPLHSGFSFGMNVHTLAYALMLATIFSGIWGAINFSSLAPLIQSHRGGGTMKNLLNQIDVLSNDIEKMCRGKSDTLVRLADQTDFKFNPRYWKILMQRGEKHIDRAKASTLLAAMPEAEREEGVKLIGLANKKRDLCHRVRDEVWMFFWLRLWLYFHLPISLALMVALSIHIFSVFFMW